MAIEYSHELREQSPDTWVFWVHASNVARLEQGFWRIANTVNISGRLDWKANIFKLVHDWLCNGTRNKWLLVLDGLDGVRSSYDALFTTANEPERGLSNTMRQLLSLYVPQCQHGSILLTTQDSEVALDLVEEKNIIAVEPMDEAQALALLQKKLGKQHRSKDIADLATVLESMPLAIVQAAAYILQREPHYLVRQYLEDFRIKRSDFLSEYQAGKPFKDWDAQVSNLCTWHLTFDYICETRPSAAQLLSFMSFFDPQEIPEVLLRRYVENRQRRSNPAGVNKGDRIDHDKESTPGLVRSDVSTLRKFSLISANADGAISELHGLVRSATRQWLVAHQQLEKCKEAFITIMMQTVQSGEYNDQTIFQMLFPHAQHVLEHQPIDKDSSKQWATILEETASYARDQGYYDKAELMQRRALRAREENEGKEHIDTLRSTTALAVTLHCQGKYKEAEERNGEALETSTRILGKEAQETLTIHSNLGLVLLDQTQFEQAEETFRRVLRGYRKKQKKDTGSLLTILSNLALAFHHQNKLEEAEKINRQVVSSREEILGKEDVETLRSIRSLAAVINDQGRHEEAEAMNREVLIMIQRVLGEEHPEALTSAHNLASGLRDQGKYKEAEKFYRRVLKSSESTMGGEHPDTLMSIYCLAHALHQQKNYLAARPLYKRALLGFKKALGSKNPKTKACSLFYSSLRRDMKRTRGGS